MDMKIRITTNGVYFRVEIKKFFTWKRLSQNLTSKTYAEDWIKEMYGKVAYFNIQSAPWRQV